MRQLTIEYLLDGHKRGYNFTSSTQGFNDDTLKAVWRSAMPRGQGWGADVYLGALSLKSFPLADGRIALSEVAVTDLRDEGGRGGIRRALVSVMPPGEYREVLAARLRRYPEAVRAELSRRGRRPLPRIAGDKQLVLAHPYTNPQNWQLVEALVMQAACERLNPGWFSAGTFIPFTTLALDYRDESQIVVLPQQKARDLRGVPVVAIP